MSDEQDRRLPDHLRDPIAWSGVAQAVKTVLAAVAAWLVVDEVLGLSQSFLAPWTALLVVHATVYRTFSTGLRQVAGAVAGVLIASAAAPLVGVGPTAIAVVVAVGLLVGAVPWFGSESTVAAATALIVLTTGSATDGPLIVDRLADTAIGVVVGLVVNLAVWPPLQRRSAIAAMDAIDDAVGELLVDIADSLERHRAAQDVKGWIERTRQLDGDLDRAWALVRQARESARMNPRRSARDLRDPREWHRLLLRLEQGVAESRSLARTVALAERGVSDDFYRDFTVALRAVGDAVVGADPEALQTAREQLQTLASAGPSPQAHIWPVEGAVLINARNVAESFRLVTESNPLGRPPLPHEALTARRSRRRAEAAGDPGTTGTRRPAR